MNELKMMIGQLTFISKSSKFAKDEDAKASGALGFGGAGRGGGFFACFGGRAGDGDSGA
jgi:hypothetical protein